MNLRRFLLIAGLAAGAYALWPVPLLWVEAAPGRVLVARPLAGPVRVRLEFTHTVERTPVAEEYEAAPQGLRLVRLEFVTPTAGLPAGGYRREGDRYVLDADRPLADVPIRVTRLGTPRLVVDGRSLDLMALAGDGGTVILAVRSRPRLAVLLGVLY